MRSNRDNNRNSRNNSSQKKQLFSKKFKSCPFSSKNAPVIDYKNVKLLIYVRFLFKKTCKTNINVLFLKDFNIYENIFYLNILLNCILIEIYNYLKMNFKLNITNIS